MSTYTLANTASEIDSAITRVNSADDTPTTNSQSMVTSGGVKAALDLISTGSTLTVDSFAITALETSSDTLTDTDTAIPTSAAVKDYVDAIELKKATLTLPTTSYSSSTNVVGWVESDPSDFLNYTSNKDFALKVNTAAKAGLYSATLKLTCSDSDTGSDAFRLEFYKNTVLQDDMTIGLNNAQNTDGGFRTATWIFEQGDTWYLRMVEYSANTVATLSNTTITVTKIT